MKSRPIKTTVCCAALCLFLFTGCTNTVVIPTNEPQVTAECTATKNNITTEVLDNMITNMNLAGKIGDIITANEKNWVQQILTDNPGLFDGFLRPDDASVYKCIWHGEFPGKLLTGIAQTYLTNNNPETLAVGERFVELFALAQKDDGYLAPWQEDIRFESDVSSSNWGKWDTWGQYHCIYGLYSWYSATGNKKALDIAVRALDNIYAHFIEGNISVAAQNWAECNLAIGHAFALFYQQTGNQKYLEAAKRIVNRDWKTTYVNFYNGKTVSCSWMNAALKEIPYYNSGQPRWEGLHSLETLAVLYRATHEEEYLTALSNLWWGIVLNDRHNTGSFGTGECATGDLYGAGSETCNTVAWMALSADYLAISRDVLVADELELSFFNATLGSLLDGERNFTYMNSSNGTREAARITLENHSYNNARDMSCCQANGNCGLTQITRWAMLTSQNSIYLNYYGQCNIEADMENGCKIAVSQQTAYPQNGSITLHINTDCKEEILLNLRIPSWSQNTVLKLNGKSIDVTPGSYATICRTWVPDDVIELTLDMSPHFWVSGEREVSKKVSVYSGPVLLAFCPDSTVKATSGFDFDALKNMEQVSGNGLLNFTVQNKKGNTVTLCDYYSAGKNGQKYVSWLVCTSGITPPMPQKGLPPVWCLRQ